MLGNKKAEGGERWGVLGNIKAEEGGMKKGEEF